MRTLTQNLWQNWGFAAVTSIRQLPTIIKVHYSDATVTKVHFGTRKTYFCHASVPKVQVSAFKTYFLHSDVKNVHFSDCKSPNLRISG